MKSNQTYSSKIIYSIIAVYFVYALLFIWNTSYTIQGHRYFSLLDDAMISMRYAANYASGHGPYFNPGGDKVEGYTNPLWMLVMTGIHLLPVAKQSTSLVVQLLGAVLMSINLLFIAKLADAVSKGEKYVVYSAVLLTASFLPLNLWALGGMEVAALVPISTAAAYYLYLSVSKHKFYYQLIFLPAIGVLLRPDYLLLMFVFYFAAINFVEIKDKKFDNIFMSVLFIVVFLTLGFRLYYYNDFVPNTYYLKMTGYPILLRITRGLISFFSLGYIWLLLIILWFNKDKKVNHHPYIFLFVVPLVVILYNIYIGGDAWDWWSGANRFISIVLPIIFVILSGLVYENYLQYEIKYNILANKSPLFRKLLVVSTVIIINIFIIFNSWQELLLLKKPVLMQDNKKLTLLALEADKVLPKDATVALATAGVIPYYLNRQIIDILGKNDKVIAKLEAREKKGFAKFHGYMPGHNKWDYSYSIGYLQPDAVVQLWTNHEEALPYLSGHYRLINAGHFHFFIKLTKNH